jgi:hypothetical protein
MIIQYKINTQIEEEFHSNNSLNSGKNHKNIIHNNNQTVVAVIYSKWLCNFSFISFAKKIVRSIPIATTMFPKSVHIKGEISIKI